MKKAFIYHRVEDYTLIITRGGEGICSVSIDENIKSCACIYNLRVEEKYRRKGYGDMLMKEAENEVRRLGADVISLSVLKDSFMEVWYRRIGYKPIFSDKEYVTLYKTLK